MKKIIFILVVITLSIGSCRKTDVVPTVKAPIIDLGTHSNSMSYANIPLLNNGKLVITVNVTPGSKYSFQLINFEGEIVVSKGLTADNILETVTLDIKDIPAGLYDVSVIDVADGEIKSPIIIH